MDLSEKYLDSLKSVTTAITSMFIVYLITLANLIQRTIKFIDDNIYFFSDENLQAQQMEASTSIFQFAFTYATLNILLIWVFALILILVSSLIIKRRALLIKLAQTLSSSQEDVSLLAPFDLLTRSTSVILTPFILLSFFVSGIIITLQLKYLVRFLNEKQMGLDADLVIAGSIFAMLSLLHLVYQYWFRNRLSE